MGPGVPYAIGAKWAHPDRPSIAFSGDGAMQMNGLAELITVSRYWQQWADPRLIIAILHNNDLNQVTWEMRAMEGAPKFAESQTLPDVDFAAFARSVGLTGINIDTVDGLGSAWEPALAADRPTVLDVRCDPNVPPIPPHATFEQAKATRAHCCTATRTPGASSRRASSRRCSSTCPARRSRASNGPDPRCSDRPIRTYAVGAYRGRRGHYGRGDLPVARRGKLRQQDDVVAGRRRADRDPCGYRRVASHGGEDRPPARTAAIVVNGLQGTYLHWRGIQQRPGGFTRYNIEAGPPAFAPLLAALVGGMGLLAAVLRRESRTGGRRLMPYRPPAQRAVTPQGPGRVFRISTCSTRRCWDDVTAGVVLGRLAPPAELAFFTPFEVAIARPMLDLLLARTASRGSRAELIDARLAQGRPTAGTTTTCPRMPPPGARLWRSSTTTLGMSSAPISANSPPAGRQPSCRPSQDLSQNGGHWHGLLPPGSGVCGPATPVRRSTHILGRGMRSDSPDRPTPAAT